MTTKVGFAVLAFLLLATSCLTLLPVDVHAAWDVSEASYAGVSTSTSPATSPIGMFVRADGQKVYIANFSDTKIYQFSLGTAWDLTTFSYDGKSFNTSSQGTPDDVSLSADGTKMFILSFYDYSVRQYTLSTPWDVSTATYDSVSLALGSANHYDFHVKRDGTKLFSLNDYNNRVQQYTLSSAWNLSTASAGTNYSYGNLNDGQELVFTMGDDGSNMYIGTATNERLHWYTLSTPWDTSTATYSGSYFSMSTQDSSVRKVVVDPDGTFFWALGSTNDKIFKYNLSDDVAPTVQTLSPADNATAISTTTNLVVTFSESVTVQSGNISIKKSSDNSLVEAIDVTGGQVTGSGGASITINPSSTLSELTEYYVQIDATAFDDGSGNSFAGISDTTTWSFTTADNTNPTITTLTPADDATGIAADDDLSIVFSEAVDAESGNITIYRASDDAQIEVVDVTGGQVTGSGTDTITIDLLADLSSGVEYYVQIAATAFDDSSGNSFAGISDTTTWSFTVASGGGSQYTKKRLEKPATPSLSVSVSDNDVMLKGQYGNGGALISEVGFEYWTDDEDDITTLSTSGSPYSNTYVLRDLECGEYAFRSYSKNSKYISYSSSEYVEIEDECEADKEEVVESSDEDEEEDDETPAADESIDETAVSPAVPAIDAVELSSIRDLDLGMEGDDVRTLQDYLIQAAAGPAAAELERVGASGYFGTYTKNALGEFQKSVGILPFAGYFGSITKEYMSGR